MTEQPALPPLLAAARALELDRDAASSTENSDYRRGMTRAVELLRILNEEESAGPAPATDGDLRERIAQALADATGGCWPAQAFLTEADAVLAELFGPIPAGTDTATWTAIRAIQLMNEAGRQRDEARAAVLPAPDQQTAAERDSLGREADRLRKDWVEMRDRAERAEAELRRLAGEAQQDEAPQWVCKCPAGLCGCGHHSEAQQDERDETEAQAHLDAPAPVADGEPLPDGDGPALYEKLVAMFSGPLPWPPPDSRPGFVTFRERIAEDLYAHDHPQWRVPLRDSDVEPVYRERAVSVLVGLRDLVRAVQPAHEARQAPGTRAESHQQAVQQIRAAVRGLYVDAGLRVMAALDEAQQDPHSCGNCDGIDPDTCISNHKRPPEQCPRTEFDGYGLQCQKPAGHNLCTFEEQRTSDTDDEARQDPAPGGEAATLLATPCDACDHTLNWHRNDVGCTVTRCVCGRWQQPTTVPARSGQPDTNQEARVHACPEPGDEGISRCCGRPPCEFVGERVTRDPDKVTCKGVQA